jgi:hypothetical protein
MHAARKRAPKSLNAALGPWNSSSSALGPPASGSGDSVQGKSNASRTMSGSDGASASPSKYGASVATAAPCRSSGTPATSTRGTSSGTYKPPSSARPRSTASDSVAGATPPRVDTKRTVSPKARARPGAATGETQDCGRNPRRVNASAMATTPASASAREANHANTLGPRARYRAAERARAERGPLHLREARDQPGAARLDQHVGQRGADQLQIPQEAARDEVREALVLRDDRLDRVGIRQHRARRARLEREIGPHHRAMEHVPAPAPVPTARPVPAARGRRAVAARRCRRAPRPMRRSRPRARMDRARRATADTGATRSRRPPPPSPRRRAAEARAERNALRDLELEAEARLHRRRQRLHGASRGVELGRAWQLTVGAGDRHDPHDARFDPARQHGVADRVQRVPEQVEADGDVSDAGRRERTRLLSIHRRAPTLEAIRSRSANTPAAVTSGPAPGPCTTSGFCR